MNQIVRVPLTGTYTPTLTIVANLDSVTAFPCAWFRIGNTVTVFGIFLADATAAGSAATSLRMSLPVATNFSTTAQAGGGVATNAAMSARVLSTAATDDVTIAWASGQTAEVTFTFQFSYQVLA